MRPIAAFAIAVLCAANGRSAQARPVAQTILVDQRGAAFTLTDLRGEPAVVTFIATRCADACPFADTVFARLAQRHVPAHLVTVTLDPRYDTPFVMSRYARDVHADAARWKLASGRVADVEALLRAFGVTSSALNAHSTLVYLIDARGRLAKVLPLSSNAADEIRRWLAAAS